MPCHISDTEAQDRGIQFLTQNLSPTQRQQLEKLRYFDVIGGETGKRYRIWHGYQMNVEQLDGFDRFSGYDKFRSSAQPADRNF